MIDDCRISIEPVGHQVLEGQQHGDQQDQWPEQFAAGAGGADIALDFVFCTGKAILERSEQLGQFFLGELFELCLWG